MQRYRVEPYVTTGDVYSITPHIGRGGWSWYSGSAGVMYRVGMENILGLRHVNGGLLIDPCVPAHWPGFTAKVRIGQATFEITVENPQGRNRGVARIEVDGTAVANPSKPLCVKRDVASSQKVRVVLGSREHGN
jgi:cyclic beta-1,2-glucan synthetase